MDTTVKDIHSIGDGKVVLLERTYMDGSASYDIRIRKDGVGSITLCMADKPDAWELYALLASCEVVGIEADPENSEIVDVLRQLEDENVELRQQIPAESQDEAERRVSLKRRVGSLIHRLR